MPKRERDERKHTPDEPPVEFDGFGAPISNPAPKSDEPTENPDGIWDGI